MNPPTVGDRVHYVSRGSADGVFPAACRHANVTEVGAGARVGLAVLNPDGLFFFPLTKDDGVEHHDVPWHIPDGSAVHMGGPGPHERPGTWHWPAHVDGGA